MDVPIKNRIIYDLCAGSGAASNPYEKAGYDVQLITLPNDIRLTRPFDCYGVLASPPCTDLAVSGARWWAAKGEIALFNALAIVDACMRFILLSNPKFWMLENPVGRLVHYLGKPKMYFNPCDYGDPYTKKTCLWGNFNIPRKTPVRPVPQNQNPIWNMPPSKNRGEKRSITPSGFAQAFFEANK